jgi:hypothetical protein
MQFSHEEMAGIDVPLTLNYFEARAARANLKVKRNKLQKEIEKSTFTPDPGRIDSNRARLVTIESAITKIDEALDAAIARQKGPAS